MPIAAIKTYIAIAVIVAIALIIGFLAYKNHSLTQQLELTKAQLVQALVLNDQMRTSVEHQNSAIDKLTQAASDNKKLHDAELATAQTAAKVIKSNATKILVQTVPLGSNNCDAALALINSEVLK